MQNNNLAIDVDEKRTSVNLDQARVYKLREDGQDSMLLLSKSEPFCKKTIRISNEHLSKNNAGKRRNPDDLT